MIKGIHGMFYSAQADELRAFLRDTLGLPWTDAGGGWPIFTLPEAELGIHPIDAADAAAAGKHDLSFYTDNLVATVADLRRRGVELEGEIADHGYGLVIHLVMPGGVRAQLFQPRYAKQARPRQRVARGTLGPTKAPSTRGKKRAGKTATKKKPAKVAAARPAKKPAKRTTRRRSA